MIAIVDAARHGLLARDKLLPNLVAGLIVGIVALPLAMAFAIASGARPEQGLYTAIVAGLAVSLFGGSRVQIAGPTGAFIAVLAVVTAEHGIEGLQIATLMAGVMLLLMGLTRMGAVIRFIPAPVIVGFTAGIGVIIFVGQWRDFFGLPAVSATHFHQKLAQLISVLPQLHLPTTALAVLSLALVLVAPRIRGLAKVPGPLSAMVVATVLHAVFDFEGVATIGSAFGGIPQGLPGFAWPPLSPERIIELIGPAFTIAMLGAIESLLSAVIADGATGTRHDSNQELVGQGVANILAPLFGGFAATGAIARTATNIRNGGSSPVAGVTHALLLVLVLVLLAPLAASIPLAALAAILFVIAWNMSELGHVARLLRRAPRADAVILLVTFFLTVFTDVVVAVNIGVIIAVLHFLRRMAASVGIQQLRDAELRSELAEAGVPALPAGLLVYEIDGPFFFAAVEGFERALLQTDTDPEVLILRLRRVPFVDISGMLALEEVIGKLRRRGVQVCVCEANPQVHARLQRSGLLDSLADHGYSPSFMALLRARIDAADRAAAAG